LIDCQVLNSHTASLGAVETPRREYLEHLSRLRQQRATEPFLGSQDVIFASGVNVFGTFFVGVL
ncbi:hypothetical protein GCFR_04683, partial [Citrobacter freundii ATCC 8090 = MTCC 1658 = NBRC 12681]